MAESIKISQFVFALVRNRTLYSLVNTDTRGFCLFRILIFWIFQINIGHFDGSMLKSGSFFGCGAPRFLSNSARMCVEWEVGPFLSLNCTLRGKGLV
jgi:hypothetical protein